MRIDEFGGNPLRSLPPNSSILIIYQTTAIFLLCPGARAKTPKTRTQYPQYPTRREELGLSVKIRADPTSVAATGKPRPEAYVTQKLQL